MLTNQRATVMVNQFDSSGVPALAILCDDKITFTLHGADWTLTIIEGHWSLTTGTLTGAVVGLVTAPAHKIVSASIRHAGTLAVLYRF